MNPQWNGNPVSYSHLEEEESFCYKEKDSLISV